ncbi:sugar ABC transporter permease [Candidatus Acetothermia bacterium]|nr:MAG: sugar ABC transporter permease [Candidatus Acetothermia bacterium]RLE35007.1 MAG: sugar ABC transporter permease [Candidatus Acetothermia bacterium]
MSPSGRGSVRAPPATIPPGVKVRNRRLRKLIGESLEAYLYLLPAFVVLGVFTFYPVVRAFQISLYRWPVIGPKTFVGFGNYLKLIGDREFWMALRNTSYYVLGSVPLTLALAILVAVLLNSRIRGRVIARVAFFIPYITPMVAATVVWRWVYDRDYGLLNYLLELLEKALGHLGLTVNLGPVDWLNEPRLAIPILIVIGIWQYVGYQAIILLAGLQNIDRQFYDAAKVDGANTWHLFRYITVPLLTPQIFFLLIISMIGAFQLFTQVFILFVGNPGPRDSAMTIVFYIYEKAFREFYMGVASAAAYILFGIIFLLTLIQFRLSRRWVFYGG